jgi:hypothetical protein
MAGRHVVVVEMTAAVATAPKKPLVQKLACDGCGCECQKTLFGSRNAVTLCDACAQKLLDGVPLAEVLAGKGGGP